MLRHTLEPTTANKNNLVIRKISTVLKIMMAVQWRENLNVGVGKNCRM